MRLSARRFCILATLLVLCGLVPIASAQQATLREAAGDRLLIGGAVSEWDLDKPPLAQLIADQFDCLTAGNEFKPDFLEHERGSFTFGPADKIANFAEQHHQKMIGHTLLWHQQSPAWLFMDEHKNPLPRDEALEHLKTHIESVVQHFHGKVLGWDVVNEGISDKDEEYLRNTPARKAIGDDYIFKAFEFAHAADPNAELYYNDYNIEMPGKREKAVRLIKELKAAGVRIDAVGIQGHWLIGSPKTSLIEEAITTFAALGVKVMVTELDVDCLPRKTIGADISAKEKSGLDPYKDGLPDDVQKKLADRYGEIFQAILRHRDVVSRVTLWGIYDGNTWLNHWPIEGRTNYPMLFDRQLHAKPAFDAVIQALLNKSAEASQIDVHCDKPTGRYATGDTIHWKIHCSGPAPKAVHYVLKFGGSKELSRGELNLDDNATADLETKADQPETLLLDVNSVTAGCVVDPDKIAPADASPPTDFDAFWKSKLAELAAVPTNAKLEDGDGGKPDVQYQKIILDNIRGTHIHGQLARPTHGEKFPALLILQWAGVYPLQKAWVIDRAAEGWLALNILPHDLPIDEPEQFYKDQSADPLKNYWTIGNDDRDTSYYLRMYLSCYRAIEYLRSRPDWDGKTLVVMGTSQGGQQTLAVAGLHPEGITAAIAFLPAACDMLAPDIGRASGFPDWYHQTNGGTKDPAKVRAASCYYDPIHFARQIRCPVLIGLGLRDNLAPPSSVLAAANVIQSPKEIVILPTAGHQDEHGSQHAFNERCYRSWLPALRQGLPPPTKSRATD